MFRTDTLLTEAQFELFPGYDNMTDTTGDGFGDQVVDPKLNNGKPDRFVPASRNIQMISEIISSPQVTARVPWI